MAKKLKKRICVFLSLLLLLGTAFSYMSYAVDDEPEYIYPGNLFIMKVEKGTENYIKNATITLYKGEDKASEVEHWNTSDKKHAIDLSKLTNRQTYVLSETAAPDGYKRANDIVFKYENNIIYVKNGTAWERVTTYEEQTQYSNAAYNDYSTEEKPWTGKSYEKKYYLKNNSGKPQVLYCINLDAKGPPDSYDAGENIEADWNFMSEVKYAKTYDPHNLRNYAKNPKISDSDKFYETIRRILYAGYPTAKVDGIRGNINDTAFKMVTQLAIYYYTDGFDITTKPEEAHGFEEIPAHKDIFDAYKKLIDYAEGTTNAPPKAFKTNLYKPNIGYYQNLLGTEFSADGLGYVLKMEAEKGYDKVEKEVIFSKTDINGTDELKGAKLSVVEGDLSGSVSSAGAKIAIDSKTSEALDWTSDGKTKNYTLTDGIYTLIENQAPLGYAKAESIVFQITKEKKLQIKQGGAWKDVADSKVQMKDELNGKLDFIKKDVDTDQPLAGAVIQIKKSSGEVIVEGTTTKTGKLTKLSTVIGEDYVSDDGLITLDADTYTIFEKAAPAEYEYTEGNSKHVITGVKVENGKTTTTQTMTNKKKVKVVAPETKTENAESGLKLKKIDYASFMQNGEKGENSDPAPAGAKIGIYLKDGTLVAEGTTTNDGTFDDVTVENATYCLGYDNDREVVKLKKGSYYVLEKDPQSGYLLNQEKVYFDITSDENQEAAVYYTNLKEADNGKLVLTKINEDGT